MRRNETKNNSEGKSSMKERAKTNLDPSDLLMENALVLIDGPTPGL